MSFMGSVLANGTNETFIAAIWVDANKVKNFSLVKVSFCAFEVFDTQLLDLIGLNTHQLKYDIIINRHFPIVYIQLGFY